MANPLFRSSVRNPIHHGYNPQPQGMNGSAKPKIVTIPVRFVSSDDDDNKPTPAPEHDVPTEESMAAAAARIQRAVRGFLVRKNFTVVRLISAEVDEIERKIREEKAVIQRNEKERLRMSEDLMALLFRLDSVRGVRDFRKKVIRRVVALQDTIDSISDAAGTTDGADFLMTGAECREELSGEPARESLNREENDSVSLDREEGPNEIKTAVEISAADEYEVNGVGCGDDVEGVSVGSSLATEANGEEEKGMREAMERMSMENRNLKGMLAELYARSTEQCCLMEGLAKRVEHLERVVHRMDRRRKRRRSATCSTLSSTK